MSLIVKTACSLVTVRGAGMVTPEPSPAASLHAWRDGGSGVQAERELDAARTEQEEAEGRLQASLEEKDELRRAAHALAGDLQDARREAQAVADDGVAMVCARVRIPRCEFLPPDPPPCLILPHVPLTRSSPALSNPVWSVAAL